MRVGVVGLGVMGAPMAHKLLDAGHVVTVYNRTEAKAQPLVERGAIWVDTPGKVAAQSDIVLSMLTDPTAVAHVSLSERGILSGMEPDTIHCDMSTVSPAWTSDIAAMYSENGRRFVQAPVLGSIKQIQAGTLLVFAGGAAENIARCEPVWQAFSHRVWRFAEPAQAATTKLACNMLIAHMITGLGQSLLFAQKGGVDGETLLDILGNSALANAMFAGKGKTLLAREFAANFYVRHMLKDLELASATGVQTGAPLPHNSLTKELFVTATQQGWGDEDYSAVVKVLELLAGDTLIS